jgi:hypothetical protein
MFACRGSPLSMLRLDDILWTVEWLSEDGSSSIAQTYNSTPVSSAYASHINRKATRAVKRKASALSEPTLDVEEEQPLPEDSTYRDSAQQSSGKDNREHPANVEAIKGAGNHNDGEPSSPPTIEHPSATPISAVEVCAEDELHDSDEISSPPEAPEENDAELHIPFIYLVKPRTRGSRRVLIPVDVSQTVGDALMNNEVDEFPSFQTLSSPPTSLSDGFILLTDYLKTPQTNNDYLNHLVSSDVRMAAGHESPPVPSCNDILATVKRDTG